jgi:hypothetical protein
MIQPSPRPGRGLMLSHIITILSVANEATHLWIPTSFHQLDEEYHSDVDEHKTKIEWYRKVELMIEITT